MFGIVSTPLSFLPDATQVPSHARVVSAHQAIIAYLRGNVLYGEVIIPRRSLVSAAGNLKDGAHQSE